MTRRTLTTAPFTLHPTRASMSDSARLARSRATYKAVVSEEGARRHREEHAIQIRRNKKEEQLAKRRTGAWGGGRLGPHPRVPPPLRASGPSQLTDGPFPPSPRPHPPSLPSGAYHPSMAGGSEALTAMDPQLTGGGGGSDAGAATGPTPTVEDIPSLVMALNSNDEATVFAATAAFRRMLSVGALDWGGGRGLGLAPLLVCPPLPHP